MPDGNYNELGEFRGLIDQPAPAGSFYYTKAQVDALIAGIPTGAVTPASTDLMVLTVAQLTALTGISAGALRLVYDATYGFGTYRYRAGTDATSAPTIYRPDSYSGANQFVWEKVL